MSPRTFPPAPGWSPNGHRIKAPLDYSRGPDKVWVYGALRPSDGQVRTFTAPSRNTAGFLRLLQDIDAANPNGDLYLINDIGPVTLALRFESGWLTVLGCIKSPCRLAHAG